MYHIRRLSFLPSLAFILTAAASLAAAPVPVPPAPTQPRTVTGLITDVAEDHASFHMTPYLPGDDITVEVDEHTTFALGTEPSNMDKVVVVGHRVMVTFGPTGDRALEVSSRSSTDGPPK